MARYPALQELAGASLSRRIFMVVAGPGGKYDKYDDKYGKSYVPWMKCSVFHSLEPATQRVPYKAGTGPGRKIFLWRKASMQQVMPTQLWAMMWQLSLGNSTPFRADDDRYGRSSGYGNKAAPHVSLCSVRVVTTVRHGNNVGLSRLRSGRELSCI